MNPFIRLLYAILIAGCVVTFIAVAINSLYPRPGYPEHPMVSYSPDVPDEELRQQQEEYDRQLKQYQDDEKSYNRNVTLILLPLTAVVLGIGLWLLDRKDVIGEGVALGGVGTAVYAIITSSIAEERVYRLAAVTLLLGGALLIAHRRFLTPAAAPAKAKTVRKKR